MDLLWPVSLGLTTTPPSLYVRGTLDTGASEVDLEPEIQVFRDFIRKRGLRGTKEREAIVREILTTQDHFDVDELYFRLKKTAGVSKASIYRTIPLLIEAGLINEVYLENGHMHYEHVYGRDHHCHLRCRICRVIVEVTDPRLTQIEREIASRNNFVSEGHKLEIVGVCPSCQNQHPMA
jgi:Fur family ferric uptake transcriptional regulator